MHIRIQKAPALVLAAALQLVPMARVVLVNQAVAPSGYAIVFRWAAAAVALLGSYHAVSGASAAIAGLANLNPPGPITTNATGTAGQTFAYRIVVTNPGVNPGQAYYNAYPLPAGLTINTNIGGNGYITGTPTKGGVYYPVTLVAGNANYVGVVTLDVMITISGSGGTSPPQVTVSPLSQTAIAGTNVAFTATATGTAPLTYLWKFGGTALVGATTSVLQLANVQTNSAGTYTVTVTNTAGSTSAAGSLTVDVPPAITAQPKSLTVTNGDLAQFSITATGLPLPTYQWKFNGTNLVGQTSSALVIPNAQSANSGSYAVDVINRAGTVTSQPAQLTVDVPASNPFTLGNLQWAGTSWTFGVSGPAQTNYVIWTSADLVNWSPLQTNFSSNGSIQVNDTGPTAGTRYYRATLSP
jgi:hypothetical protein